MIYKLFTDGATSKNGYEGSYGGYAWALVANDKLIDYGLWGLSPATNNQCELKALINGCNAVLSYLEPFDIVLVYSDSSYAINCYKEKWYENWRKNNWKNSKKEPVANKELWQELIPFFENLNFKFEKVKGHSNSNDENSKWNNYVDKMAVEAKERFRK